LHGAYLFTTPIIIIHSSQNTVPEWIACKTTTGKIKIKLELPEQKTFVSEKCRNIYLCHILGIGQ
jgi:hypothetical protein